MRPITRCGLLVSIFFAIAMGDSTAARAQEIQPVTVLSDCVASTTAQGTSVPITNVYELAYSASISCPVGSSYLELDARLFESTDLLGSYQEIASASSVGAGTSMDLSRAVQQQCLPGSTIWIASEALVFAEGADGITRSTLIHSALTPVACDAGA